MSERETLAKILDFVFAWTLKAFLLALPLFWLPLTADYFEFNKVFLFYLTTLLLCGLWVLKMVVTRTVYFRPTPFDLPLFLVLLTTVVAAVLSTNQYYSLLGVPGNFAGTLPMVVAGYGFFYCVGANVGAVWGVRAVNYFVIGSVVSALLYLLNLIGVPVGPWGNTAGSGLDTVVTYLLAAMLAAAALYGSFRDKGEKEEKEEQEESGQVTSLLATKPKRSLTPYIKNTMYLGALAVLVAAILLTITPLRTFVHNSLEVSNAPLPVSWSVAATTIASRPYFGSGPATWQNDYSLYKPISVNDSPDWNTRFAQAGSFYLQVLAENGVLGLLAWILLVGAVIKGGMGGMGGKGGILIGAVLLLWVFTPGSVVGWVVFLTVLVGAVRGVGEVRAYQAPMMATALACLTGLILSLLVYQGYQVYAAEYYFKQSLDDLTTNQGRSTYKLQQLALGENPWIDRYHRAYVQTNLALAATILNSVGVGSSDPNDRGRENPAPTETEQNTVNALLTQASREVQTITEVLGPASPENWETRGSFYKNLVNVSKEAAGLSLAAYQNAVGLDPYSPRLRWELGQAYQAAGDLNNAVAAWRVATLLKSDFASAHYSLAQAYKENKQYELALAELKTVNGLEIDGPTHGSAPTKESMEQIATEIAELEKLVSDAKVAGASASASEASPSAIIP